MADRIAAIDCALSIGPACRAKHHLQRHYGPVSAGGIFDWQMTPTPTILEYLRRDFTGFMELDDLVLQGDDVFNTRFGTTHLHEFPKGMKTQEDLKSAFRIARSRHDHLCAATRKTLRSGRPILLAMSATPSADDRTEILEAFMQYAGRESQRLHFVFEPTLHDDLVGWQGDAGMWDAMLTPYPAAPVPLVRRTLASLPKRIYRRLAAVRRTGTSQTG